MLEQCFNISNIYRQGEFEFSDSEDKREEFLSEIDYFKSKGRL